MIHQKITLLSTLDALVGSFLPNSAPPLRCLLPGVAA